MILVTHPNKPLPRAGKGTILRKQALAIYNEEIEKLYVLYLLLISTSLMFHAKI